MLATSDFRQSQAVFVFGNETQIANFISKAQLVSFTQTYIIIGTTVQVARGLVAAFAGTVPPVNGERTIIIHNTYDVTQSSIWPDFLTTVETYGHPRQAEFGIDFGISLSPFIHSVTLSLHYKNTSKAT